MNPSNFDWLLPTKPFLRVREVAAATGMGATFLEDHFKDAGKCHGYNGGAGKRESLRIPRAFVVELLVKSAKYDAEAKRDAVLSCLRELGADDLVSVANVARALAERQASSTRPLSISMPARTARPG